MDESVNPQVENGDAFRIYLINCIDEIKRDMDSVACGSMDVDFVIYRLEQLISLAMQGSIVEYVDNSVTLFLYNAHKNLKNYENHFIRKSKLCKVFTNSVGRPSYDISKDSLVYFHEAGFSQNTISSIIGVSTKTVSRRMKEFNINDTVEKYSDVTDILLDTEVSEIVSNFPSCGIRMVKGYLLSKGFKVTWERVRESLWRVDPQGILNRSTRRPVINRRVYSVPGTLALLHMDGNHKLIRWGFVIHGGIDGYSRKIMFLKCSTNNRSATVFQLFTEGVQKFGLPSRVRADQGGENVEVARFMLSHPLRGPCRRSFIAGKSCHNQRIERLWRDVFSNSLSKFYCVFWHLEDSGHLDISNEVHLYVLHLVFTLRINLDLISFRNGWDNHSIRTARNRTPNQLWILGKVNYNPNVEIQQQVSQFYGIDFEGPLPEPVEPCQIDTTNISDVLTSSELQNIQHVHNFSEQSDSFGIDIFLRTLESVSNILKNRT